MNYYLDATKITNFNCTDDELECRILFWILAAGKNGVTSAVCLGNLLNYLAIKHSNVSSPFKLLSYKPEDLPNLLKAHGIGCYRNKAKTIKQLIESDINLRTCTVDDLEVIHGIGPKTSRCFIIHSRANQRYAGLDTHILKFMRDQGFKTPKSTPNKKQYKEIERQFIFLADKANKSIAEFDLAIWNEYRTK